MIKEFGSDCHFIKDLGKRGTQSQLGEQARYYANGRQAIQSLILFMNWKRIWMPEYFCYEIVDSIEESGIQVKFYKDYPTNNEEDIISSIPFQERDVLLRMNYFGLRNTRDNSKLAVPVIEDHSHDLIGNWAANSNADWCIASLRKSLPIAEGGILWSPKHHELPEVIASTTANEILSQKRFIAMKLKGNYLEGLPVKKEEYRTVFQETESEFDKLEISGISKDSLSIVNSMDIQSWYQKKRENWLLLSTLEHPEVEVLKPESSDFYPFSLVLKFNNKYNRDLIRNVLSEKDVYTAILWQIPAKQHPEIVDFGDTCISVYCDARYNIEDAQILKNILLDAFTEMV